MKKGYKIVEKWFSQQKCSPFSWQRNVWDVYLGGSSGLLNAPTGSGKTLALL